MIFNPCVDCHHQAASGCALNPVYWRGRLALHRLDLLIEQTIAPIVEDCDGFRLGNSPADPTTTAATISIAGLEVEL